MIKKFVEGCIPKKISAEALISNFSLKCYYRVEGIETGSPLKKINYRDLTIECNLPKGWFLDLSAEELEDLDFVRSHGRGVFKTKDWNSVYRKNAVTHYYLHPSDYTCIIVRRKFHRLSEILQETLKFSKPIKCIEIQDHILKLRDQKICIIFSTAVDVSVKENEIKFSVEGKDYGYVICFGEYFEKIKRNPCILISLEPDITQPGQYLEKDEETEIKLKVEGIPRDIESAEISLYGLVSLKRRLLFKQGKCQLTVKFRPKYSGIVPLLVLVEGKDFLYFSIFDILVLPTVVKSPDSRFNGVFVEYIRSMLQRRIFNVVPEEDPRGEMIYHHGFWPRNLYAYDLFCFGFREIGVKMIKAFGYLLEKYRFLFDSYSLYGQEVFSNPLVSISNDGIGFYLFQAGKILLRRPDLFDEDFKRGIEKAVTWLDYSTHWNGLLFDKTEAVDHCRSERLVGNPYSQSICMAGLKVVSKALKECGEKELSRRAEIVFKRQLKGFKKLYGEIGYFRDLVYIDGEKPRLSTYSMPAPGCFLLDLEVEEHSLDDLVSETMKIIKDQCTEPNNPWAVTGGTGHLSTSYAQLGTVAALLNLGAVDDAWRFLNEILKYAESTSLKYMLPEKVVLKSHREDYEKAKREHEKRAPWLYTSVSEKLPGWPCNPGNLVHMSYFLFIVDLMCGISHSRDKITIKPRIPSSWNYFSVKNYFTRYGPVSYEYKKEQNTIHLTLRKPYVLAEVITGPLKGVSRALINNKKICFETLEFKGKTYIKLKVPEKIKIAEIILILD